MAPWMKLIHVSICEMYVYTVESVHNNPCISMFTLQHSSVSSTTMNINFVAHYHSICFKCF
jgi:hypothetical protein